MSTLSRRTITKAVKTLERWTRTEIERFLYENDVPIHLVGGDSKLKMLLNVFQAYETKRDYARILELIQALHAEVGDEIGDELEASLISDGFAVDGNAIVDAEPEAEERRSAVLALLEKHRADFAKDTLVHHLNECEDLFRQNKWDSSISHCRNFVEQLLGDVAQTIAATRNESPTLTQPRLIREYLERIGFFDSDEKKKLVDGVYGYFSAEGSHPGISTQSAARVSKSILLSFAFYVLEKHAAWRVGIFQLLP